MADVEDAFPSDASEFVDTDGDSMGNNADPDDDNDGVADANDAFPLNANGKLPWIPMAMALATTATPMTITMASQMQQTPSHSTRTSW